MKFQIGDRVRVMRKAKSNERGWQNSWITPEMNRAVGRVGTVADISLSARHDVTVNIPSLLPEQWGYPAFVLKLAPKKKKKKKKAKK